MPPEGKKAREARAKTVIKNQLLAAGFRLTHVKHAHAINGSVLVTLEICVTAEVLEASRGT